MLVSRLGCLFVHTLSYYRGHKLFRTFHIIEVEDGRFFLPHVLGNESVPVDGQGPHYELLSFVKARALIRPSFFVIQLLQTASHYVIRR